jgi:hypothetical protein
MNMDHKEISFNLESPLSKGEGTGLRHSNPKREFREGMGLPAGQAGVRQ